MEVTARCVLVLASLGIVATLLVASTEHLEESFEGWLLVILPVLVFMCLFRVASEYLSYRRQAGRPADASFGPLRWCCCCWDVFLPLLGLITAVAHFLVGIA